MVDRRGGLPTVLTLAVLLVGCAARATPPTSPTGSMPPAATVPPGSVLTTIHPSVTTLPSPTIAASPTVSPGPWPYLDPATVLADRITCSPDADGPMFTVAAFNGAQPGGEYGTDAAAAALRKSLGGEGVPPHGWRRLVDTAEAVLFVAPAVGGGWRQVLLWPGRALGSASTWGSRTIGECHLGPAAPADASFADLWLDSARLPTATARTVRLLLVENACASGASPAGRIQTPTVIDRPDGVVVLISVTRPPGNQDCQGNPEYPFDVALPTALGARSILNAARLPPALVRPWGSAP